jgi:hypothetical protein
MDSGMRGKYDDPEPLPGWRRRVENRPSRVEPIGSPEVEPIQRLGAPFLASFLREVGAVRAKDSYQGIALAMPTDSG